METVSIGLILVLFTIIPYVFFIKKSEKKNKDAFEWSQKAGLDEPVSLHPQINPDACLCSGACVKACPEKDVLGIVSGRAQLIQASRCIGHGACADACPVEAIQLVFGTATRGIEIPKVTPHFESNIPNLYIVGELGGMGLIRHAVDQGRQAIAHLAPRVDRRGDDILDVVIVGAGPAGVSASLEAKRLGLKFVTLEQHDIGGAINHYPRKKLVMTHPMDIPLFGKVHVREMLKEELMDLWMRVIKQTDLAIQTQQKVEQINRRDDVFEIQTLTGFHVAKNVVLAIGRRGTPRKLGVPGEGLSKVAYSLLEPEQFQGMSVLVVGGGDSALEAACALAEEPGNRVTVSYRREKFQRPKEDVRRRFVALLEQGKIEMLFSSQIEAIESDRVLMDVNGAYKKIANDQVFIFAGGEVPTDFLKKIGVSVETKFGTV
jgi:thioredoxin reductase (NADPH)